MAEEEKKEEQEKKEEKTFTQDEVNALVAKGTEKEQKKLLKELGVESSDDIKAAMKKLKELEEKAKPEEKKDDAKNPELESIKKESESTKSEVQSLKDELRKKDLKAMAIDNGVDKKYADTVVTLVFGKKDFDEEAMKTFLNENPIYLSKKDVEDFGGPSGKKSEKDEKQMTDRLRKAMGLTEKKK